MPLRLRQRLVDQLFEGANFASGEIDRARRITGILNAHGPTSQTG